MIGNDIIDIQQAKLQSNWQRKGFLNKVFTTKEQQLIFDAPNSFICVWKLWSMKESAYKVYVQQHNKPFFNPKRIECFVENNTNGFVLINKVKYLTHTTVNNHYIYTNATLTSLKKETQNICFYIKNATVKNQRAVAYQQLKLEISKTKNMVFNDLVIKKNNLGVPLLYYKNQLLKIPFSISHHGNYGATSILNN